MNEQGLIRKTLHDLKASLGQFAIADALFKLLAFILLTPLTSWLLQRVIGSSGGSAVSNTDIIRFLLSPIGLLGIIIVTVLTIGLTYAEQTGLMTIAFGQVQEQKRVGYGQALKHTREHAIALIGLGAIYIGTLLLLVLPVAAVVGLLYLQNLTEHDINYYLETMPPELWRTVAIAAPLVIALVGVLFYLYIAWLFALPSVLFENVSYRQALRHSRQLVSGSWWRVARLFLGWFGLILVGLILFGLLGDLVSQMLLNLAGDSLALLVPIMGMILIGGSLVGVIVNFVLTAVWTLLVTRLYREITQEKGVKTIFEVEESSALTWRLKQRWIWAAALLGVFLAALIGWGILESANQVDSVLITAHRGSSAVAPPNTLAAVRQAIADGADYAEIDVQETADGVLIVNHDSDYLLAAGVAMGVHELSYAEVQKLDVGTPFSPEFAGEKIPTLGEVLDVAKGKIKVNVELKYYGEDQMLAERVIDTVREKGMEAEVLIMSLEYAGTQEVKQLAPEIEVGFLASLATLGDLTELNVDFLAVSSSIASTTLIERSHDAGKELFVWTLNETEDMSEFIDRGVDSIITDYPVRVKDVLAERAQMSNTERLLLSFSHVLAE